VAITKISNNKVDSTCTNMWCTRLPCYN